MSVAVVIGTAFRDWSESSRTASSSVTIASSSGEPLRHPADNIGVGQTIDSNVVLSAAIKLRPCRRGVYFWLSPSKTGAEEGRGRQQGHRAEPAHRDPQNILAKPTGGRKHVTAQATGPKPRHRKPTSGPQVLARRSDDPPKPRVGGTTKKATDRCLGLDRPTPSSCSGFA